MKLRPAACCRSRTWPGPGSPTSTGSQRMTSGPPGSWIRIAFGMLQPCRLFVRDAIDSRRYQPGMDLSEFSTPPARILIHDPVDGAALHAMGDHRLDECNFLDMPAAERLIAEYRDFRAPLAREVEIVTLRELLGDDSDLRR